METTVSSRVRKLFRNQEPKKPFDGESYDTNQDYTRLKSQLEKVRYLLSHPRGRWWKLKELASCTGGSEAGISARIRDLRKDKHGGHEIERKRWRLSKGLWVYRMTE